MKTKTILLSIFWAFTLFYEGIIIQAQEVVADSTNTLQSDVDLYDMSLEDLMNVKIVSASKKEEKISDAPSNITVITSQQIKEWGVRDLKDVMRRVAGYQVIADRDEWVFAARGNVSDNNQKYLILLDGQRMNSIENFGPGNIIELPNNLANVQRIEIIKGPGSAVWGADALAGVINIITKNAGDLNGNYNGSATIGQDGYYVGDFQLGEKISEKVEYMLSGAYSMQDGRDVLQSPATDWPILNTDTKQYTTKLDYHRPGYMFYGKTKLNKLTLNALYFETEVNNRHFEMGQGRENFMTTNKSLLEAKYDDKIGNVDYTAKLSTFNNFAEYRPSVQGVSTKFQPNIAWRDRGITAAFDLRSDISDWLNVSAGVDYTFTKMGPNARIDNLNADKSKNKNLTDNINIPLDSIKTNIDNKVGGENSLFYKVRNDSLIYIKSSRTGYWFDTYAEDSQVGGYTQIQLKPIKNLAITFGLRGDYNGTRGSDHFNLNPRAALVFSPIDITTVKAVYNHGYLRPTNFQAANPNVKSETMDQLDFIVMQKLGMVNLSLTAFWQELNGVILIGSDNIFANVGDYTSQGIELELNANISKSINVWANGTFLEAEGKNFAPTTYYFQKRVDLDGKLLAFPSFFVNAGGTLRLLDEKLFISPAIKYSAPTKYRTFNVTDEGKNTTTARVDAEANYTKTNAFAYVDLNIGYTINKNIEISVYSDNLLDVTDQAPITVWDGSVGQYGRHILGKIKFSF